MAIVKPGIYDHLPESAYHADPALSSTGARRLIPPSCPAKFRYHADHGERHSNEFDIGKAAHTVVLGDGPEFVIIDAANYKTKKAQEERAAAYSAGKVPLLTHEHEQVQAMAAALRNHDTAASLFDPARGRPEQSLFWRDPNTKVMCRARPDFLRRAVPGKRLVMPDYKSTDNAHPDAVQKSIGNFGYHIQGAWYLNGLAELGLAPDGATFVIVAQEKTPPYLVSIVAPTPTAMSQGADWCRLALDTFHRCLMTDEWPGYGTEPIPRELPRYVEQRYEIARASRVFDLELT